MLDDLIQERLKKLNEIKKAGFDPYPASTGRTLEIAEAHKKFSELSENKKSVFLAGRLMSMRDQGNISFLDLADEGGKIQIVFKKDILPKFDFWKSVLDIGDFLEVEGPLFKTQKGEESLEVHDARILTKSLRPIPSEWYGVQDIETRLRKRYLDLIANKETRELFRKKAVFWQTIRNFMIKQGFLEVWTPVLENIPGGADAEPFVTHHNALNRDFYLRISLELPLKRLLVGGYDKVFEIGRLFRNEGIDREHLQEYDDMEFYWAYADWKDGMKFVEKLFKLVVKNVAGSMETEYERQKIDWDGRWPKVDYFTAFKKETGLDLNKVNEDALRKKAEELGVAVEAKLGKGRLIDAIYKKTVRPKLIQPCFLVGHPVETSPLSKLDPKNPQKVLRFQVLVGGSELGNGFSELNDPLDQRERFEKQMKLREAGDTEAQMMDEDFVEALEYAMPPAVGFGASERLFSVIMDKPMRETVIFPPMKEHEVESKTRKSKINEIAVAVINKGIKLEPWQELNTVAHLTAAFGAREGRKLFYQDEIETKDNQHIKLNIQHAIMIKAASSDQELQRLVDEARKNDLHVAEFIREMIETTDDRKIISSAKSKDWSKIEYLGVLIFGEKSRVEELTSRFQLYK